MADVGNALELKTCSAIWCRMDDHSSPDSAIGRWVEIEFDCLPLRTVQRVDVPMDASPKYQQFVMRVKEAIETHGVLNTYYLHNATCIFHLTNHPSRGMVEYRFEGTVLTDQSDSETRNCHLEIELVREDCDWLTETVVRWLCETVREAVSVEFNRYIAAGDLSKAEQRIKEIQAESDAADGYMGMYL